MPYAVVLKLLRFQTPGFFSCSCSVATSHPLVMRVMGGPLGRKKLFNIALRVFCRNLYIRARL